MYPNQYQQPPSAPAQDPRYAQWLASQQAAQPAQPSAPPAFPDGASGDFSDPSTGGGGFAPRIRHLTNRTVIIEPLRVDETAMGPMVNGVAAPRPCAYAHVTVVDGGPIEFGNEIVSMREVKPNTHRVTAPYRITDMMISNSEIVRSIRDALGGRQGLLVGVVVEGNKGNRPFLLTKTWQDVDKNDRPEITRAPSVNGQPGEVINDPRRLAARAVWDRYKAGQLVNAMPELLPVVAGGGYGAYAPSQPYGQPQQFGVPATYNQPPPAAAPVDPAYAAWLASQQPAAPAQGAPPAPAGWDPAVWAGFTPEQRQSILARQQPASPGPQW